MSIQEILADDEKLTAVTQAVFSAVDTDGSGQIDRTELKAAMVQVAQAAEIPAPDDSKVDQALNDLDANKDGKIDVGEFKVLVVEILKALAEE